MADIFDALNFINALTAGVGVDDFEIDNVKVPVVSGDLKAVATDKLVATVKYQRSGQAEHTLVLTIEKGDNNNSLTVDGTAFTLVSSEVKPDLDGHFPHFSTDIEITVKFRSPGANDDRPLRISTKPLAGI